MADLTRRRESAEKRRGADAAVAAECADDLMERMLDESRPRNTGKGSGGGLLDNLGPVGPPMSFAPENSAVVEGNPGVSENLEVEKHQGSNLGVRRVVVTESQSVETPIREDESRRPPAESVSRSSKDGISGENIGKGRGSGSTSKGVESRPVGNGGEKTKDETRLSTSAEKCEKFYIGEKPPGLDGTGDLTVDPSEMMNPWSREKWRERGFDTHGAGIDWVLERPLFPSCTTTPQKVFVDPTTGVEMDPVELFRLRCIREAEEKFRMGIQQMEYEQQVGQGVNLGGEKGSQCSFQSARENQEPFVPKPPPGPPPPSPPKISPSSGSWGNVLPPVPPFPSMVPG